MVYSLARMSCTIRKPMELDSFIKLVEVWDGRERVNAYLKALGFRTMLQNLMRFERLKKVCIIMYAMRNPKSTVWTKYSAVLLGIRDSAIQAV
jgi:hypothetical protein